MKTLLEDQLAYGVASTQDMAQYTPKLGDTVQKRNTKNPAPFGKGKEMEAKRKKAGHGVKRFKKWRKEHQKEKTDE